MCRVIADAVEEGRFIASRRAARDNQIYTFGYWAVIASLNGPPNCASAR
jgi:hypothetical protein